MTGWFSALTLTEIITSGFVGLILAGCVLAWMFRAGQRLVEEGDR